MRVALVHDWLFGMRGGERCLEALCDLFPGAPILTLFLRRDGISEKLKRHPIEASTASSLPGVEKFYRYLLPAYPLAVSDLSRRLDKLHRTKPLDAVISISHCGVKNIRVPQGVKHLCYCLTPMRYLWDQYDAYFARNRLEPVIRRVMPRLRNWDRHGASGVDSFVSISSFVGERIEGVYGRKSDVIFPPVSTEWLTPRAAGEQGDGFLCVSALVPYKNVDAIVQAFNSLQLKLTVVGDGPERGRLERMAGSNVTIRSHLKGRELADLYRRSKAFVFAAEEDFGMAPVESLASGRPVIALARGGALETVSFGGKEPTGVPFLEPSPEAICHSVRSFLDRESEFPVERCLAAAEQFSVRRFREAFSRKFSEFMDRPERTQERAC